MEKHDIASQQPTVILLNVEAGYKYKNLLAGRDVCTTRAKRSVLYVCPEARHVTPVSRKTLNDPESKVRCIRTLPIREYR